MAGISIWQREHHIVKVELSGPRSEEEIIAFDDALRSFVEERGGTIRILAKEKDNVNLPPPQAAKKSRTKGRRRKG
jgi:hypothetical protein